MTKVESTAVANTRVAPLKRGLHSEGCPRKRDPISARSSASFLPGTRRCWGGLNRERWWNQESRSASQKRRQPWLTFSTSLIPGRTSAPARRWGDGEENRLLGTI
jgi:hypothetical protein